MDLNFQFQRNGKLFKEYCKYHNFNIVYVIHQQKINYCLC